LNRGFEGLNEKNHPLLAIAAMVPFESFRPMLKAALIKGGLRKIYEHGATYDVVIGAPNPDLLLEPGMTATID